MGTPEFAKAAFGDYYLTSYLDSQDNTMGELYRCVEHWKFPSLFPEQWDSDIIQNCGQDSDCFSPSISSGSIEISRKRCPVFICARRNDDVRGSSGNSKIPSGGKT